jgi:KDO2-lipid IV(A) lauroyltransferase
MALGRGLGFLVFSVLRVRRRVTLQNLEQSLQLPREKALRLARRVYGHLCTGALEFLRAGDLSLQEARAFLGEPQVARLWQILGEGRGMLVLTAHLGNWDLLACAAARCGIKVNIVTRRIRSPWLNEFWMEERRSWGVTLLPAAGSARAVVAALRRNEAVAVVLDQHEPEGVVLPFFGRPAATGTSLARLARATGAPVVPAFLVRVPAGFHLDLLEPIRVGRTADVRQFTALFLETLEKEIRSHSDQWLWLHRRWKVRPAS